MKNYRTLKKSGAIELRAHEHGVQVFEKDDKGEFQAGMVTNQQHQKDLIQMLSARIERREESGESLDELKKDLAGSRALLPDIGKFLKGEKSEAEE